MDSRKTIGPSNYFKIKLCEFCWKDYIPTGSKQRWCRICVPNLRALSLMQRYGISLEEFEQLIENQKGKCALCDKEPKMVDHDHSTGRVRGILCYSCNLKLSGLDDKEWRKRAEEYCHAI